MVRLWKTVAVMVMCVFASWSAFAQSNYSLTVTITTGAAAGTSGSASYGSQAALLSAVRAGNFSSINAAYQPTDAVALVLDFNGGQALATISDTAAHTVNLSYAQGAGPGPVQIDANSRRFALVYISELIGETPPVCNDVNGCTVPPVCTNPNGCTNPPTCTDPNGCPPKNPPPTAPPGPRTVGDPFCGNPGAVCNRMVERDFELGTRPGRDTNFRIAGPGGAVRSPIISINPNFSFWSGGGVNITLAEIPFTYIKPLRDPRYAFIIDAPIMLSSYNGDQAVSASIGAGMRLPMTDKWIVTPVVRIGAMAATDLDLNGFLWSASLVSNYETKMGELDFSIGNQLTHIRTIPISANDYDHQNTILRNGVGLAGPTDIQFFGKAATWEALLVNTQWFGDDVYVSNQTDLGISIGTQNSDNGVKWDSARLGVTLTFTDREYSGFSFNFGYKF